MGIAPINSANAATDAYGLNFQSLLQIILTQLRYQDPLKPVDNYQFVSQLGQFAQLQQSQTLNDRMTDLFSAQASVLSVGLLGKTVDVSSGQSPFSGVVQSISFATGQPSLTVRTTDGEVISGVSLVDVTQVR